MHKYSMHMFNVWTIIIQSLNIKEWKLFKLQITHTGHSLSSSDGKCLSSTALKSRKCLTNLHKKDRHMFNIWTIIMQSLNIKEWKLFELQITQTRNHLSISNEKMSKFKAPQKWKKIFMKCSKNRRCTSSMCGQSSAKFEYKRMDTVGVTDYTN